MLSETATTHTLSEDDGGNGDAADDDYGIRLAERFGMPRNVVATAREMRARLAEFDAARADAPDNLPAALEVFKVLNAIRKKTAGKPEETRDLLARLQEKLRGTPS